MERDLLIMIYGAIMGVVGSIVTSIVTAIFHFWLDRREFERRKSEEHRQQLQKIYLPSEEEVISINAEYRNEQQPQETARSAAEAGSLVISVILSSAAVYQTRDPMLGFSFGACLGFLVTRRITGTIKQRIQS
jgi:predicted PurR-regulated permease PerM